ncbi:MAG: hypothetical protein JNK65_09490 [Deltaproteobacteria bacterium]|nr:hypothetical protein [Deltaproteobacteria bacterium]
MTIEEFTDLAFTVMKENDGRITVTKTPNGVVTSIKIYKKDQSSENENAA